MDTQEIKLGIDTGKESDKTVVALFECNGAKKITIIDYIQPDQECIA